MMNTPQHSKPAPVSAFLRVCFIVVLVLLIIGGMVVGRHLFQGSTDDVVVSESPTSSETVGSSQDERDAGLVTIRTVPDGATLFVNGHLVGATPIRFRLEKPGTYGVRLEKKGHVTVVTPLEISGKPVRLTQSLDPVARGSLEVDVEPRGAEVLLDGELVGLTPLKKDSVPAGQYELIIRKTNFEPYTGRIEILPGKTLTYKSFSLRDKILAMLRAQVNSEPQRLAHYLDLAHYLFVNNRIDDSVEAYIKAQEIAERPIVFPEGMGPEERAIEQRLRNQDRTRLKKELVKHKRWRGKYTRLFREKLERAQEIYSRKNIDSWTWVEMAARNHIRNGKYVSAEQLYLRHLKAAPRSPHALKCCLELLKVRLKMRNVSSANESFTQVFELSKNRPDLLLDIGQAIMSQKDRVWPNDRDELLEMAEKAFRRALDLSKLDATIAESSFELARVLTAQDHPAEAIAYFEQSIKGAPNEEIKEDRQLELATALRLAGRLDDAHELLIKLKDSAWPVIRERAKAGLILLRMDRP